MEKQIDIPSLAKTYKEYYHAAFSVLKPHQQETIKNYASNKKLSKEQEIFARDWHRVVINKAEAQYFEVKPEKIIPQIKELSFDQIFGGNNNGA